MTHAPLRDRSLRRCYYNSLWLAEHICGDGAIAQELSESRLRVGEELSVGPGELREVERCSDLDPETFRSRYLRRGVPVVFEGAAAGWKAVDRWSPAFFAENYNDTPVQLINAAVEDVDADGYDPRGKVTTVGEVVAAMSRGEKDYPRFVPLLHAHPELLQDFDGAWLQSLRGPLSFDAMFQFFMGGAGTNTALHGAIPNNLFVQVYGEKEWWIYPPAATPVFRPPMLRATYFMSPVDVAGAQELPASGWHTVLKPGDVLYNPPFYWHQVRNLSATIGVGMRWFALSSILRSSVTQTLLTLMSRNPPIWRARQNRTNFVKNFVESAPHRGRSDE